MSDTISKSRERAETAFGLTQTQFLMRNRVVSEIDAVAATRDEKTARLRALRLERIAAGPIETVKPSRAKKMAKA